MLFTRQFQFNCSKNAETLYKHFLGKHLTIHQLDFEVYDEGDHLKVIPHTEDSDQIYTLPITKVMISPENKGASVKVKFTPRHIDIGGPYLLLIFICFAIVAGLLLIWFNTNVGSNLRSSIKLETISLIFLISEVFAGLITMDTIHLQMLA